VPDGEPVADHLVFASCARSPQFTLGPGILPRFITDETKKMSLRTIIHHLKRIYCALFARGLRPG
jgi:2-oxoglutarate dehydrogenase E1 component